MHDWEFLNVISKYFLKKFLVVCDSSVIELPTALCSFSSGLSVLFFTYLKRKEERKSYTKMSLVKREYNSVRCVLCEISLIVKELVTTSSSACHTRWIDVGRK